MFLKYGLYKFKDYEQEEVHYIASLFRKYYELKIEEVKPIIATHSFYN